MDPSSDIKNFEPKIYQLELPGHSNSALVGDLRPHLHYKARIFAENSLGRGEASAHVAVSNFLELLSGMLRQSLGEEVIFFLCSTVMLLP